MSPVTPPPPLPPGAAERIARLNRIRDASLAFLGAGGDSVVTRHYQKARTDLEGGAGDEAIEEAVAQIVKATAIVKGPPASESLAQRLKAAR